MFPARGASQVASEVDQALMVVERTQRAFSAGNLRIDQEYERHLGSDSSELPRHLERHDCHPSTNRPGGKGPADT